MREIHESVMQADTSTLRSKKCWCKHLISLIFTVQRQITLHLHQKFSSSFKSVVLGDMEKEEKSGEYWADGSHSKSSMRSSGWAWWLHVWQRCYEEIMTTHRRVRTYGGVISLTHCKRCSWLHKHSSIRQCWFATARPKGDKTFESKTVTDIHITSCII